MYYSAAQANASPILCVVEAVVTCRLLLSETATFTAFKSTISWNLGGKTEKKKEKNTPDVREVNKGHHNSSPGHRAIE